VYPQTLGSLSVSFYNSQGYDGGDLNQIPHPGGAVRYPLTHKFEADRIQNTAPSSDSTFCVRIRCHAGMNWSSLILRPTVSRLVHPRTKSPPGDHDQTSGRYPRREDRSAAHNRCRASPALSLSGTSRAGPATTFHHLRFETYPFVASHDSQGNGGGTRPRLQVALVTYFFFKL
jgi:hypothetical protein